MENKTILALAIIAIVFGTISLTITLTINIYRMVMIHREEAQIDDFEIEQRVCYLPRDCFGTEKKYSDQFPGGEIPDKFPVCLVYCHDLHK